MWPIVSQIFEMSRKKMGKRNNCGKQWTESGISLCWSPMMCPNSFYILHWTSVVAHLAHLVSGPHLQLWEWAFDPEWAAESTGISTVIGQEEISDLSRGHERSSRTITGMLGNRGVSVCGGSGCRYLVQCNLEAGWPHSAAQLVLWAPFSGQLGLSHNGRNA